MDVASHHARPDAGIEPEDRLSKEVHRGALDRLGLRSEAAEATACACQGGVEVVSVSLSWLAVSPEGELMPWPRSPVRRWWLRRRGWTLYDRYGQKS